MYNLPDIPITQFIQLILSNFGAQQIKTIFEVGSRDGKDAIILKTAFPKAIVYAFEGHPVEYELHKNELTRINWVNLVISNIDGQCQFHSKQIGSGIHSLRDRGILYGKDILTLPCNRLDTFCKKVLINSIDVVKVDVEGCTYEVLLSLGNLLSQVKILHIETETQQYFEGQHLHTDVVKLLEKNNFKMIKMTYNEFEPKAQHDSVWVKKE